LMNTARGAISDQLDQSEGVINSEIEQTSKWFAAGDVGFAVSSGQGRFGGGVNFGLKIGSQVQLGAFVNSALTTTLSKLGTPADTIKNDSLTAPPSSIFGLRFSWALGKYSLFNDSYHVDLSGFELDLLASSCFGQDKVQPFSFVELGGGLSYQISSNWILGGAFYELHRYSAPDNISAFPELRSVGLTIKFAGASGSLTSLVGAPTLLLGWTWQSANHNPAIQVSLPIN